MMYPTSNETTNYARLCRAIIDLCTDVLRHILGNDIVPSDMQKEVTTHLTSNSKIKLKLNKIQHQTIGRASVLGYTEFDITLLYGLIRFCGKTLAVPRKGWGQVPNPGDITVGDDIERIRELRNLVYGHIPDTKVSKREFNKHWNTLKDIMQRMTSRLGKSYDKDLSDIAIIEMDYELQQKYIHTLEEMEKMEKETRKQMTEFRGELIKIKCNQAAAEARNENISGELTKIKDNQAADEARIENISGELKKIKKNQAATESRIEDIHDNAETIIRSWEVDDLVFCETNGVKNVIDAVQKYSTVTVIGNIGVGKSATIHHVALSLKKSGYFILPIRTPDEIYKYHDKHKKQIFVLDDPVGVHSLDKEKFMNWVDLNDTLTTYLSVGTTKILSSVRKQVYNESEFQSIKCVLNQTMIDIEFEDNKLTDEEKLQMIEKHLEVQNIELEITHDAKSIIKNTQELFPLCCKMFSSNKDFRAIGWDFFKFPSKLVKDELEKIKCADKIKYCLLVLCFAFENSLDSKLFYSFNISFQQKIKPYITACELTEDHLRPNYERALNSLLGVYLHKENNVYRFMHDFLYDIVGFHFGTKNLEVVINYSSSKYICNRVSVSNQLESNDLNKIIITPDCFKLLVARLLDDLNKGFVNHVVMNKCWDDDAFFETFIRVFEEKRQLKKTTKIGKLFHRKKGIIDIFIQKQGLFYIDDIKKEINDIKQSGVENTWSWYYTAMQCLKMKKITPLHWIVTFAKRKLFNYIWEILPKRKKKQVIKKIPLLHHACLGGDVEICRVLLKKKRNKTESSLHKNFNVLPLHFAAYGSADVVKLLVDHGANINSLSGSKRSALWFASGHGKSEIVHLLVDNGAEINVCDYTGCTPLIIASQNNHIAIVEHLLNYKEVNICNNEDLSASEHNRFSDHRCDVDASNNDGWSALMIASKRNHTKIVKVLLDHQCDMDLCDNKGWSALMIATKRNHKETVELLLNHCDVNLCTDNCWLVLKQMSQYSNTDTVKLLIDHQYDVVICNNIGSSSLMVESENKYAQAVQLCESNVCDKTGLTALEVAKGRKYSDLPEILQKYEPCI